jgi:threonyl-tRNA synthetase
MAEAAASEQDRLYRVRHSIAHIMAQAVLERYPAAGVGIGPPIENGFYYDFDLGMGDDGRPRTFTPEDLDQIEARMRVLIAERHPFVYRELTPEDAR